MNGNRKAGYLIGQGKTAKEAMEEIGQVVEGILSAKAADKLGQKYDVELPIVKQINKVLFEEKSVNDAIYDLLVRQKTEEHNSLVWGE